MSWTVSSTNTRPMTGSSITWPVMSAIDRERRAERQGARVAHEHLRGVDVEPQEAQERADDDGAQDGQVGLGGQVLSAAMAMKPMNAKTSRPPARPSSPSVMFTALLVATMAKAPNRMYSQGSMPMGPDEGHRDVVDVVGVLDLPRHDERHDGLPDQLLACPDAVAGAGVQPVVRRAQGAHERERGQRREGARIDELAHPRTSSSTSAMAPTTRMMSRPPIVGVPSLL